MVYLPYLHLVDYGKVMEIYQSNGWYGIYIYMGVSINNGTPKWMVYNGKPY